MIITTKAKRASHYAVRNELKEVERELGRELDRDETLKFLFGDFDGYSETDLDIMVLNKPRQKLMHRLNMLWAWPLTLLCAPIAFVISGDIGWSKNNAVGRFIIRATGYDQ